MELQDYYDIEKNSRRFHEQLMTMVSLSKDFLGMSYDSIMKMPLCDFYLLLKIKSREEKKKQEYLEQEQKNQMRSLNTNEIKSKNFFNNKQ